MYRPGNAAKHPTMPRTEPHSKWHSSEPIVPRLRNLGLYLKRRCWLEGSLSQSKGKGLQGEWSLLAVSYSEMWR